MGSFYSHVNYSVTKINLPFLSRLSKFYSHVNYSVTKIGNGGRDRRKRFTVT